MKTSTSLRALAALTLGLLAAPLWSAEAQLMDEQPDLFFLQQNEIYNASLQVPGIADMPRTEGWSNISDLLAPMNRDTLYMLNEMQVAPSGDPSRVNYIEEYQAAQIRDMIATHPVVGRGAKSQYDPDGKMGFCFGRATFVHLELLRRGVNKNAIGKIFVVGEMKNGAGSWRYHVATIVKGPGNSWWAIDSIVDRVMTVGEWMTEMALKDANPSSPVVRFYASMPQRLEPMPGSAYIPGADGLSHQVFRSYFDDLMAWFRANPVAPGQMFTPF